MKQATVAQEELKEIREKLTQVQLQKDAEIMGLRKALEDKQARIADLSRPSLLEAQVNAWTFTNSPEYVYVYYVGLCVCLFWVNAAAQSRT